jgi:hypothetical protein
MQLSKEEALGLSKDRKQFDIREEYYVSPLSSACIEIPSSCFLPRNSIRPVILMIGRTSAFLDRRELQNGAKHHHPKSLLRETRERDGIL